MLKADFYRSSVGKKVLVAITGLVLICFVVGHLLGNLLIFFGPDALNTYAKKLVDLGALLWTMRIFLIVAALVHIGASILITIENKQARPIGYAVKKSVRTTFAARTMILSGLLVLAFIIYHLLHFTFRVTHPEFSHLIDASGRHDVYTMVVSSFQSMPLVAAYVVAMILLCGHLSHGIASTFQTLGLNDERAEPILKIVGISVSMLLAVGYISIPVAVLMGVIGGTS